MASEHRTKTFLRFFTLNVYHGAHSKQKCQHNVYLLLIVILEQERLHVISVTRVHHTFCILFTQNKIYATAQALRH